jgi:uncharacterized membrane protein
MNSAELETRARAFFDAFVDAFASFNGQTIAERYLTPYLAFHSAASAQVFTTSAETAAYFQTIVDGYQAQGCRSCRYKDMAVVPLGEECAIATVTWDLLAHDLSVISAWRESYNLCLVEGRFMVFTSTDHAA